MKARAARSAQEGRSARVRGRVRMFILCFWSAWTRTAWGFLRVCFGWGSERRGRGRGLRGEFLFT